MKPLVIQFPRMKSLMRLSRIEIGSLKSSSVSFSPTCVPLCSESSHKRNPNRENLQPDLFCRNRSGFDENLTRQDLGRSGDARR